MTNRKLSELSQEERSKFADLMLGVPYSAEQTATGVMLAKQAQGRAMRQREMQQELRRARWASFGAGCAPPGTVIGVDLARDDRDDALGYALNPAWGARSQAAEFESARNADIARKMRQMLDVLEKATPEPQPEVVFVPVVGVVGSDIPGIKRAAHAELCDITPTVTKPPTSTTKPTIKGIVDVAPIGVFGSYGKRWGA